MTPSEDCIYIPDVLRNPATLSAAIELPFWEARSGEAKQEGIGVNHSKRYQGRYQAMRPSVCGSGSAFSNLNGSIENIGSHAIKSSIVFTGSTYAKAAIELTR